MAKKAKKQIKGLVETSMIGAAGSIGLGAIGGTSATHGQIGIGRAMSFAPTIGTMTGAGMMMRTVEEMPPKKRKRRR